MQLVLFTPEVQRRIGELAAFASEGPNWYVMDESHFIPGDDPRYVAEVGTVRVVFTWTKVPDGRVMRHMSISNHSAYPSPVVVWTFAHMLGFTGAIPDRTGLVTDPGEKWGIGVDDGAGVRCIVIQEPVLT